MDTKPFDYYIVDNFFPEEHANALLNDLNCSDKSTWDKREDPEKEIKWRSNWKSDSDVPLATKKIIDFLNSGDFLRKLSSITGVNGLIPDPYFTGGGFNEIYRGGLLHVHRDGNWHDLMGVHRRLNLIVYLNKNWQEEWGGELQLWSKDENNEPYQCEVKISPIWNRAVIFRTDDFSYHGHPEPLNCPENESRKSLILYYYTNTRPKEELIEEKIHRAVYF